MSGEHTAHAPGSPSLPLPTLDHASIVRDAQTGEVLTAGDWVTRQSESSGRPEDVCLEELMNAVARGDLICEKPGEDPVI